MGKKSIDIVSTMYLESCASHESTNSIVMDADLLRERFCGLTKRISGNVFVNNADNRSIQCLRKSLALHFLDYV
jgi:hypothetical protein